MDPVLIYSDPHFHNHKSHSTLVEGVNSRLLDGIGTLRQAVKIGIENKCKLLVIDGDIFHVRGVIRPSVFNRVCNELSDIVYDDNIDVLIIPGNHDYENFDGTTAIESLAHIGNEYGRVWVATQPKIWGMHGYIILTIPYIHDIDRFKNVYSEFVAKHQPHLTFIHQGIDNLGDEMGIPRHGLTAEFLASGNPGFVFAGHYHRPARFGGTVISVGSPYQQTFNDEGYEHGCWVYDGEGTSFFPLESPKFITIEDGKKFSDWDKLDGNIVRIKGKSQGKIDKLMERAKAAGASSITSILEKEFKPAHEKTISISNPRDMLSEYIGINEIYTPHKSALLRMFDRVCLGVGEKSL